MATLKDGLFFDRLDRPCNGQIVFSDEEREMIRDSAKKLQVALARAGLILGAMHPELAEQIVNSVAVRAVVSELGPMDALNHSILFAETIRAGQRLGELIRTGSITPEDISNVFATVNEENN